MADPRYVNTQNEFDELRAYLTRGCRNAALAVNILMNSLWNEENRKEVSAKKICNDITCRKAWGMKREPGDIKQQLKIIQKHALRLNARMSGKRSPYHAWIKYKKKVNSFILVTEPSEVGTLVAESEYRSQKRKSSKPIQMKVKSEEQINGMPVLKVGDIIQCSIKAPISGYLHLFHVDVDNFYEKIFPLRGVKKTTVRSDRTNQFPKDFLKEGFEIRVGKAKGSTSGIQHIIGMISRQDITISEEHLRRFGVGLNTRGVIHIEPTFESAKPGSLAYGMARYEMRDK